MADGVADKRATHGGGAKTPLQSVPMPAAPMAALRIVVGAVLLNLMTGSLYAWSLFLEPVQQALGVGRTAVSSIFAVATVAFAVSMICAPHFVRPGTALRPALIATVLAAGGLMLAGASETLWGVIAGYGVLFGLASGIGYSAALQAAVGAMARRRGLATGIIVCAYAFGAVVFAPLFRFGLGAWDVWQTFLVTACVFAGMGVVGALLLIPAQIPRIDRKASPAPKGPFWRLWIGFFFGASAGLMALGHAAAIVNAYDLIAPAAALGTGLITAANGAGRLASGFATDYWQPRTVLLGAQVLAAIVLAGLAAFGTAPLVYIVLALTGFAYGSMASGYPAATLQFYGPVHLGRVYGQLFSAWGAAGLTAPLIAGALFDWTGSYTLALAIAACAALLSVATIWTVPIKRAAVQNQ